MVRCPRVTDRSLRGRGLSRPAGDHMVGSGRFGSGTQAPSPWPPLSPVSLPTPGSLPFQDGRSICTVPECLSSRCPQRTIWKGGSVAVGYGGTEQGGQPEVEPEPNSVFPLPGGVDDQPQEVVC